MPKIKYEIEKGRLGADPEISYNKDNTCIARLSIAVNQYYKDKKSGEWEQKGETSWINGAAFGYTAECIESMELAKGDEVFAQGTMEADIWEDDDGEERKSWNFYINRLFPVPKVDFDEEEEEEEDRPRSRRSSKRSSRSSSRRSSRSSKKGKGRSSRSKKSTKFKKGKAKTSYADKILKQLNK